jgi:transcriptional regulator with XRE-family HTH domain
MATNKQVSERLVNQRLIDARHQRQWSQQEVANRIGTTALTVSRWERGITTPGRYFRQQLCELFRLTPEELGIVPIAVENVQKAAGQAEEQEPAPIIEQERTHALLSFTTTKANEGLSEPETTTQRTANQSLFKRMSVKTTQHDRSWIPIVARSFVIGSVVLVCVLSLTAIRFPLTGTNTIARSSDGKIPNPTPVLRGQTFKPMSSKTVPAVYGGKGTLMLNDALKDGSSPAAWHVQRWGPWSDCGFTRGVYRYETTTPAYCLADETNFADFIYEIQMTIVQGDTGGITFRANDDRDEYYFFQLRIDGHYMFYSSGIQGQNQTLLGTGFSPFIKQGHNQSNVVAVKAIGKDFFFYVNLHPVSHFVDPSFKQGNIGVFAGMESNANVSVVTYQNAKVWGL